MKGVEPFQSLVPSLHNNWVRKSQIGLGNVPGRLKSQETPTTWLIPSLF